MVLSRTSNCGHVSYTDVSITVCVDVFENLVNTLFFDSSLSVSSTNGDTIPLKLWSNVPVLVSYSDLLVKITGKSQIAV
jgi:hypothetical protein